MKNPFCPQYEKCLSLAAYADTDLDCTGCPYERTEAAQVFDPFQVAACKALILAILHPGAFLDQHPQFLINEYMHPSDAVICHLPGGYSFPVDTYQ